MSDTEQMTITEFLEARIAEDESVARECLTHQPAGPWMDSLDDLTFDYDHFARWNPDRVLSECAAKRAILGDYLREYRMRSEMDRRNTNPAIYYGLPSDKVLRQITSVYADHPDYQQEWE